MKSVAADIELFRRYDLPLPRYTSYPTAPHFTEAFGEQQFRSFAQRSNRAAQPRHLSLYMHIPYCTSPCFYCGCNRVITRNVAEGEAYVEHLLIESERVAKLFDPGREVIQLHLGGGTPNFLSSSALRRLLDGLRGQFSLSDGAQRDFSIEIDPRYVETGYIAAAVRLGLNRVSLGVQDFDPAVQAAVNRVQSIEQTQRVIDESRAAGVRSINLDLICGLPRQGPSGFARTLQQVLRMRPERIALYSYAHHPELFKAQRRIAAQELPDAATRLSLLRQAIEALGCGGYEYIGMDHFALPEDDLAQARSSGTLHRNFMGYTTHADCDLLGLGMSAISSIGESFSQNPRSILDWRSAVTADRLPTWRGVELTPDDSLRRDVIQRILCQGEIVVGDIERKYGIAFQRYFAPSLSKLQPLVSDELVTVDTRQIRATPSGRLFLRNIASCFDLYMPGPGDKAS